MNSAIHYLSQVIEIYRAAALLAPGALILLARSVFVIDIRVSTSAMLSRYLIASVIYYAIVSPFIPFIPSEWGAAMIGFGLIVALPVLLGFLLGVVSQKELIYRALRWIGLNPIHRILTAWDWKFSDMSGEWVLVTLKDGTCIQGWCGRDSFISSNPDERDLYIESAYPVDGGDDRYPTPDERRGVWIAGGEISTIEFSPHDPEGVTDHAG